MELYRRFLGHRPSGVVIILLICCGFVHPAPDRRITDLCDWSGSGLEFPSANTGVQPIYLRCSEGKVEWHYPRGALRVVLHLNHFNKDFQACFKVLSNSSGATLHMERQQKLHLMYDLSNAGINSHKEQPYSHKGSSHQVCFRSISGQVVLFLEAQSDSLKKDEFSFLYDLQPIQLQSFSECRPCTDKELIYAFCTSDFVVRGTISSLYQNEQMKRTELVIRGHQILRDSEPQLFRKPTHHANKNRTVTLGLLHRPLHCGTKAGSGEFLFLGRWRLGDPVLKCAPRWTEWKKVRRRAAFTENTDCILS